MPETTLTAQLTALKEQQKLLETQAETDRSDLINRLREACSIAGLVSIEELEGIVAAKKRGRKAK